TALALSNDDQTAPARVLGKFAEKAGDEKFNLKAGYIEGEIYDQAGVTALSKIPSKDVLLAQLVGSLQGPMQKLAATLQALADKNSEEGAA
ncbi:MAG: 50S ribosomal protein L10, partial [Ruminococcus sp.]|nr:50S ribosomal protein L10 [Ruminococcus sp.]